MYLEKVFDVRSNFLLLNQIERVGIRIINTFHSRLVLVKLLAGFNQSKLSFIKFIHSSKAPFEQKNHLSGKRTSVCVNGCSFADMDVHL